MSEMSEYKPDYSEWLTPKRLEIEEAYWERDKLYVGFADAIIEVCDIYAITSVIELGCGTGWVATQLPSSLNYTGLDANIWCIRAALKKDRELWANGRERRAWLLSDIRDFCTGSIEDGRVYELVCAFSVFKHFNLVEWDDVVSGVLQYGKHGLFTIPIGERGDNGTEFPHVTVSIEMLEHAVRRGGHRIVSIRPQSTKEVLVTTKVRA